jgi:hypothetical protein
VFPWSASEQGWNSLAQTQRLAASWDTSRPELREDQARRQERGEQERVSPGRPQRESKARGSPVWARYEKPRRAPDASDSFLKSRRDEEEQLGLGWSREGSYSELSGLL